MTLFRIFFIALALLLVSACSDSLTDSQYMEKAKDHLDKGEVELAAIELKNALQQNPSNPGARRLLGEVHFELGDMAGAEKELLRAQELGVANDSVLPRLARAFLGQKKYTELEALSEHSLSFSAGKAEVLAAKGLGKLGQGNLDEAKELIDEAVSVAPDVPFARLARAYYLSASQDYDAAEEEIQRTLDLDPKNASAWSLLGSLQRQQGELEEAEAALTKAIDSRRLNTDDLLNRAFIRIQLNKNDDAQADVDILKKRAPKLAGAHFAQGLLDLRASRLTQAKSAFETTLKLDKRQLLPNYYLAQINLSLGNVEQADAYAEQVFSAEPRSAAVRKVLARTKIQRGDFERAESLVWPVVMVREDDAEALELLATAMVGRNQHQKAIPFLERLKVLTPDSATIDLRLGSALMATGKVDEGVALVRKSIEKDPGLSQGYLLLAQHYARLARFEEALEVAEDFRKSKPDSPTPLTLIGILHLQNGAEADAIKAFERARQLSPGDPGANHKLADLSLQKQDSKAARAYFEDVLKHDKDHLETLLKLATLDAIEQKDSAMVAHLERARAAHPKAVPPAVMLARHYLAKGEADKVAPLMVELDAIEKEDPGVLEVMAYAQLAQKQYADAEFTLERLLDINSEEARLYFLMATAKAGLNKADGVELALQRAVALEPNYFKARVALARLGLLGNRQELARSQLAELEKLAPEHPDVLDLKAKLASIQGETDTASGLLEKIFEQVPSTETMLSVARQKWSEGDLEGALVLQEQWVEENPQDLTAMLALAETYRGRGEPAKAIAQYEKVLRSDDDNVIALNDLAWHLRESDPVRALDYAESAHRMAPESPQILDTLAMVQLSNGRIERARRSIERALQKDPGNPSFRYHNAVIVDASGDDFEAARILSELIEGSAEFPEREQAQQMLQRLHPN